MKIKLLSLACVAMVCTGTSFALDASGQRYTKMLASGGPGTISSAAQDIYNTGVSDQEVLDVAAQVLSEFHLKSPDTRDYADATAWLCKALGNSGNARYRSLLEQVTNAKIHRKTRSHCNKAMDALAKDAAAQFVVGSVDVAAYRDGGAKQVAGKPATVVKPAAVAAPIAGPNRVVDFAAVKEGMSMQEVDELLGPPTNQTTYMTGKQFQPFNFGARDVQRTKYLYKGVGHIVFSLKSAYNGQYRVIEIVPDPAESGYP
ncbi:MAG: hypothetical protein AB7F79_13200 [Steroidobacteraceae bacterium]